jgi:hypothetical protein
MKREAREGGLPANSPETVSAGSRYALRVHSTTGPRAADPDFLRLSYICHADSLLRGRAGRSAVLAQIHRSFDGSDRGCPDSATLCELAQLIDLARADSVAPAVGVGKR